MFGYLRSFWGFWRVEGFWGFWRVEGFWGFWRDIGKTIKVVTSVLKH